MFVYSGFKKYFTTTYLKLKESNEHPIKEQFYKMHPLPLLNWRRTKQSASASVHLQSPRHQ